MKKAFTAVKFIAYAALAVVLFKIGLTYTMFEFWAIGMLVLIIEVCGKEGE